MHCVVGGGVTQYFQVLSLWAAFVLQAGVRERALGSFCPVLTTTTPELAGMHMVVVVVRPYECCAPNALVRTDGAHHDSVGIGGNYWAKLMNNASPKRWVGVGASQPA
jgi:hypothetical protein